MVPFFVISVSLDNSLVTKLSPASLSDKSSSFAGRRWSRRGSNPRPNDEFSSFLHAYFSIGFRSTDGQEHPNR